MLNKVCKKKLDETVEKVVRIFNTTRMRVIAIWLIYVLNLSVLRQQ